MKRMQVVINNLEESESESEIPCQGIKVKELKKIDKLKLFLMIFRYIIIRI